MPHHPEALVEELSERAQQLRREIVRVVYGAQSGHLGGALSAAEILAALFWHHLRLDPARPDWPERDRFLLSKGHASALLYATLAHRGYFPVAELDGYRRLGSRLTGHPDRATPGVEIVAGPLGHGVAIGSGLALALRANGGTSTAASPPARVYVLLGDGELQAGVIWEGAMTAARYRLDNLCAIVDCNGMQQTGTTADIMPLEPLVEKWRAFGWYVDEIDGHNVHEVLDALDRAGNIHARPTVILAHTTKGRGVGFMENDPRWHSGLLDREHYERALADLRGEV